MLKKTILFLFLHLTIIGCTTTQKKQTIIIERMDLVDKKNKNISAVDKRKNDLKRKYGNYYSNKSNYKNIPEDGNYEIREEDDELKNNSLEDNINDERISSNVDRPLNEEDAINNENLNEVDNLNYENQQLNDKKEEKKQLLQSKIKIDDAKTKSPLGSDQFIWPVQNGKVIKHKPKNKEKENDEGIVISSKKGSKILASADGVVIYSKSSSEKISDNSFGNFIIIKHSNGYFTAYGYNKKNLVKMGDKIRQGDTIALSGPKIYFAIKRDNKILDPEKVIK